MTFLRNSLQQIQETTPPVIKSFSFPGRRVPPDSISVIGRRGPEEHLPPETIIAPILEKVDQIKQRGERDLSDEESWTPEQEEYRRHLMKQKLKQDALLKKEKLERGRSRPRERSRDLDARSSWQDRAKERAKSEPKVKDRSKSEPNTES